MILPKLLKINKIRGVQVKYHEAYQVYDEWYLTQDNKEVYYFHEFWLKLVNETQIAIIHKSYIINTIFQNRQPIDTHTKGKALVNLWVDTWSS